MTNPETPRSHPTVGAGFVDDPTRSFAPEGAYYTDPATYDAEIAAIFRHEWHYVCHQNEVRSAGDYRVVEIGEQSVYVIRDREGELGAFHNVCQHRGHQLLTGHGTVAGSVQCPYHAWTYSFGGELRAAPNHREVPGFDKTCVSLATVQLEVVAGFVFVNLDDQAVSLRARAPRFESKMLEMVTDAERLQYVTHQDYDIAANWKVVSENFLEAYHVGRSGPAHDGLAQVVDLSTYRGECDGIVLEYLGVADDLSELPYATDGPRSWRGRPYGLQQIFLWPNVSFSVFPGANMLFVFLIAPAGVERVAERIIYYSMDGSTDRGAQGCIDWINGELGLEDVALVESVQRGLNSVGYRPGRLMVDADRSAVWSEHYVHHFNRLTVDAVVEREAAPHPPVRSARRVI